MGLEQLKGLKGFEEKPPVKYEFKLKTENHDTFKRIVSNLEAGYAMDSQKYQPDGTYKIILKNQSGGTATEYSTQPFPAMFSADGTIIDFEELPEIGLNNESKFDIPKARQTKKTRKTRVFLHNSTLVTYKPLYLGFASQLLQKLLVSLGKLGAP